METTDRNTAVTLTPAVTSPPVNPFAAKTLSTGVAAILFAVASLLSNYGWILFVAVVVWAASFVVKPLAGERTFVGVDLQWTLAITGGTAIVSIIKAITSGLANRKLRAQVEQLKSRCLTCEKQLIAGPASPGVQRAP